MNSNRRRSIVTTLSRLAFTLVFSTPLLLSGTPYAAAQVDRAVLEGTVTDPSGSVIPRGRGFSLIRREQSAFEVLAVGK